MEEKLRQELKDIWLRGRDGEITREEADAETKELIHVILEVNPHRLLDLCREHITGLSDAHLLRMAKEKTKEFVYMNISAGSYHYSEIVKNPSHPDSRKVKMLYRELLRIMGLEDKVIQKILNQTSKYEDYNSDPAGVMLDVLCDQDLCANVDWKFGLEDVEYNLNLIAKKLGMEPVKEYPPYEEGQPLGIAAMEQILEESGYVAVIVADGDSFFFFLTTEEKVEAVKSKLDEIAAFWEYDEPYICRGVSE